MDIRDLLNSFLEDLPIDSKPPTVLIALDNGVEVDYSGDRDLIFDMGSLTKIISTTSIILKLVENKELNLEDLVSQYLPGKSLKDITIKNLLCHRAGLWEWRPFYIELENNSELLCYIGDLPLRYKIDSARHYSDLGFIALGAVIVRITQTSLDVTFTEMVAKPLALTHTNYSHPISLEKCIPSSYGDRAEFKMVVENSPYPVNADPKDFSKWRTHILQGEVNDGNAFHVMNSVSGHAGLFSSASDVMAYGRELLRSLSGGGFFDSSILSEFLTFERDHEQALGFQRYSVKKDSKVLTAFGHTGFPGVALAIVPERDLVLGLFTNRLLVTGESFQTSAALTHLLSR